jgi:hypothetical protein
MLKDPVEAAKVLLKNSNDPDGWNNFAYFDKRDLSVTWAIVGPHVHRDSGTLDRSNYECILRDLREEFPDAEDEDWEILGCSHWLVGWIDSVMCKVFTDQFVKDCNDRGWRTDAPIEYADENDLHPIFLWLHNVATELMDYPVYDEMHFSELEYEEAIDNIQYVVDSWVDLSGDNPSMIASWLSDISIYVDEDVSADDMHLSALCQGLVSDEDEALEWWNDHQDVVGISPEMFAFYWNLFKMNQMQLEIGD